MPRTSAPWMTSRHPRVDQAQPCSVVVSATSHPIRNRIVDCLRDLDLEFKLADGQTPDMGAQWETLFLLDSGVAARMSTCPQRTIVVFADRVCPLSVLRLVASGQVIPLGYEGLDQEKMCRAIIRCFATDHVHGLAAHLSSHEAFATVPIQVIDAFSIHPERLMSLSDLCQVLSVSPDKARIVVRRAGCRRSEHLFVRLRVESWVWFSREGFRPSVFERYLGIRDRSDFRRACRRAGLELPWRRVG
jgi:hypothetical protein